MAKKEEINGLIIYLLSDSSSYVNGSIISIDGGRTSW
jgi:NAD(P)-dependent dehydrogenase (short-subunit alcohol dehydrogenase family)